MIKLLIGTLLVLTTANALAGNMYAYKDSSGQALLTNKNPSGNFDQFTKRVKVVYPRNSQSYGENKSSQKQEDSKEQNESYVYGTVSDSALR